MSDTIKEFLAELGFKVDEPSWRKFNEAISGVTGRVGAMGELIVGTAGAIGLAVEKVAQKYNDLYYVAQRTGASVKNLQALEAGFTKIGLTAEGARGLVEGFADALTQPGKKGLLGLMGVPEGDPAERLLGLIRKLNEAHPGDQQRFIRQSYAQQFGIDNASLRTIELNLGELTRFLGEFNTKQAAAGDKGDEAAEKFKKFWQVLKDMEQAFDRLGRRIAESFLTPVQEAVRLITEATDKFSKFNEAQGGAPGMVATVAGTAGGLWAAKALIGRFFGMFGGGAAAAGAGSAAAGAAPAAAGVGLVRKGGSWGMMLALLEFIKSDSESGNKARSWLREALGITETEEERAANPWARATRPPLPRPSTDNRIRGNLTDEPLLGLGIQPLAIRQSNTTTINIAPGPTADDTARSVAKSQDRLWQDATRNLPGLLDRQ